MIRLAPFLGILVGGGTELLRYCLGGRRRRGSSIDSDRGGL